MAEDTSHGCLTGVGLGPGDPELITLKGEKAIRSAAVIAFPGAPRPDGTIDSLARRLAAPHVPPGVPELPIPIPMSGPEMAVAKAYDTGAEAIAGHLAAGRDVAYLCAGDPLLYGSFAQILIRLQDRHTVRTVPGIPSPCAAAARLGVPLIQGETALTFLPATLPDTDLEPRIALSAAAAIFKIGRHLPRIVALLDRMGRLDRARYIERATWPDEDMCDLKTAAGRTAPYFSMILVLSDAAA